MLHEQHLSSAMREKVMSLEKLLVQFTAAFFLIYGCMFALLPTTLADWVTGAAPTTSSGLIDMRATYGGMSIAVGIIMLLLASKHTTLRLGLLSVAIVLLGMASARALGIIADGSPNNLMYVYLAAEIVPSIVAIALYRRMGSNVQSHPQELHAE